MLRFSLVAEIQCRTQSLGQLGESVLSITWIELWSYGVKQKTKGNELDVQMSSMVTTSWMASLIGTPILVGFLSFWSTILLTLRLKMKRTAWMDFPDLVWWSTWSTRLLFHPLKFVLVQLSLNPRLQIILAVPAHLVNKTFAFMQFNVVSWMNADDHLPSSPSASMYSDFSNQMPFNSDVSGSWTRSTCSTWKN